MSERQKLQWYTGRGKFFSRQEGHYSLRLENGTYIEVEPDVYNQRFNTYLEHLGMKRTSWSEIMQKAQEGSGQTTWYARIKKAEDEWNVYCQIMDTFAENYQQWLDDRGNGIFVEHPQEAIPFK